MEAEKENKNLSQFILEEKTIHFSGKFVFLLIVIWHLILSQLFCSLEHFLKFCL